MRLSRYFLPTLKENPAEAQIVSHRLMLRAGMIKQATAGIYSWLPLGFKVLRKLENIVHEEQIRAGHIPMLMPTLQSADLWRESGRYDDYGEEMLRITDRQKRDLLYGPTNEEMITDIFRSHVGSYKDLPMTLYHIQWKFRDEMRPRFGVMRCMPTTAIWSAICAPTNGWACRRSRCGQIAARSVARIRMSFWCWPTRVNPRCSMTAPSLI